jgi:hypothetical protein
MLRVPPASFVILVLLPLLAGANLGCRRSAPRQVPTVVGPLPAPPPPEAAGLTFDVPVAWEHRHLTQGDWIQLAGLRGDRPRLEEGGTYVVWGWASRKAEPSPVKLMLWNADGENAIEGRREFEVPSQGADFVFRFRVLRLGEPHLSLYPLEGGSSLGSAYFGPAPVRR